MTKNAKIILDIINRSTCHDTVYGIYEKAKKENPKIVLATVYNNVNALLKQGYVRVLEIKGQPNRYDTLLKHDHLVCGKCGKIIDVYLEDITESIKKQTGVDVISYDLQVNYVCPDCLKKQDNK